jgi:hypothetical protein
MSWPNCWTSCPRRPGWRSCTSCPNAARTVAGGSDGSAGGCGKDGGKPHDLRPSCLSFTIRHHITNQTNSQNGRPLPGARQALPHRAAVMWGSNRCEPPRPPCASGIRTSAVRRLPSRGNHPADAPEVAPAGSISPAAIAVRRFQWRLRQRLCRSRQPKGVSGVSSWWSLASRWALTSLAEAPAVAEPYSNFGWGWCRSWWLPPQLCSSLPPRRYWTGSCRSLPSL